MRDTIRKSANRYGRPRKSQRECFLEDENVRLNNIINSTREQTLSLQQRVDGLERDNEALHNRIANPGS
jgi:hypothetical protein